MLSQRQINKIDGHTTENIRWYGKMVYTAWLLACARFCLLTHRTGITDLLNPFLQVSLGETMETKLPINHQ